MKHVFPILFAAMMAVIVVGLFLGADVVYYDSDEVPLEDVDEYGIAYELDGGSFAYGAKTTYIEGTYTLLPVPERDGMHFAGWYSDPGCEVPKPAILPGDSGDMVFYAKWIDYDPLGTQWLYDFHAEYDMGDSTLTADGNEVLSFVTQRDGVVFKVYNMDITYSDGTHIVDEDGEWADEGQGRVFKYIGNGDVEGRTCAMFSDGNNIQWMYLNTYALRVEQQSTNTVMTMTEVRGFTPDDSMDLDLWVQKGLTVRGDMPDRIGDSFTLTATGGSGIEWTCNGVTVSGDRTVAVDRCDPYDVYRVYSDAPYTVAEGGSIDPNALGYSGPVEVYSMDWKFIGEEDSAFPAEPGLYYLVVERDGAEVFEPVLVNDHRTFTQDWSYGGRDFTMSVDLDYSVLFGDMHRDGYGFRHYVPDLVPGYLDPGNPYVSEMAGKLRSMGAGFDGRQFAEFVLQFVRDIPFMYDEDTHGASDYWQFPSETLWVGGGDCEDSSILYASLMNALGYDSCLMVYPTHAMAGVVLEDPLDSDQTFVHDGRVYSYAETTNSNIGYWKVSDAYPEKDMLGVYLPQATV